MSLSLLKASGYHFAPFVQTFSTSSSIIAVNYSTGVVVSFSKNDLESQKSLLELEKNKILTKDYDSDFESFVKYIQDQDKSLGEMNIHFIPTLNCNFKCHYCFEQNLEKSNMNLGIIPESVAFIKDYINKNNITFIHVELYGGEPTLNWDIVITFVESLHTIATEKGIELMLGITTNGFLLNPDKIDFLINHGLKRIQITLDGPESVHNSRRMHKTGKSTYGTIIDNLKYLDDKDCRIETILRFNYDAANICYFGDMVKDLSKKLNLKKVTISLGKVDNGCHTTIIQPSDSEIANLYLNCYLLSKQYGFKTNYLYHYGGMCVAKKHNAFTIMPDGKLLKCVGFDSCKIQGIGTLSDYVDDSYVDVLEPCIEKKCVYLPLCYGGCPYHSVLKSGTLDCDCNFDDIASINEQIITKFFKLITLNN